MPEPTLGKTEKQDSLRSLIRDLIPSKKTWVEGKDWVQYAGNTFTEDEYMAAIECLLDGWLALGENGIRFERRFRSLLGKDHGALTNSGSSANLLMVSSLKSKRLWNLPQKTKVITPVAGFPTTVNPIIQNGFEPAFVDIELDTLNLNLDQVEQQAKKGAKVLIFAHVLGNPPDMDRVIDLVRKYDLILLEDCCDALGSTYGGKRLGSFGEMASCSFYPAHHISMGEGGFVACRTRDQETVIKSMREWGRGCYCSGKGSACLRNGMCKRRFSEWLPDIPDVVFDHKYIYEEIGYNLKPLDLQAAIGLVQMDKVDQFVEARKRNFARLTTIFSEYQDIFHLPSPTTGADPSWFAFPLTIRDGSGLERSSFTMHLEDHKIQTRNYFGGNLLLQPAFRDIKSLYCTDPKQEFPIATKVTKDTFFLGTSQVITEEQIDYICRIVRGYFASFR